MRTRWQREESGAEAQRQEDNLREQDACPVLRAAHVWPSTALSLQSTPRPLFCALNESRHCSLGPLGLVEESRSWLRAISANGKALPSCHRSPEEEWLCWGHVGVLEVTPGMGQEAAGRAAQYSYLHAETTVMEEPGALGEGSRYSVWWSVACKWDEIRNQVGEEVRRADTKG